MAESNQAVPDGGFSDADTVSASEYDELVEIVMAATSRASRMPSAKGSLRWSRSAERERWRNQPPLASWTRRSSRRERRRRHQRRDRRHRRQHRADRGADPPLRHIRTSEPFVDDRALLKEDHPGVTVAPTSARTRVRNAMSKPPAAAARWRAPSQGGAVRMGKQRCGDEQQ